MQVQEALIFCCFSKAWQKGDGLVKYIWIVLAVLGLAGLFWLNWKTGVTGASAQSGYLYDMPDAATEAGYCIAVVERIREITHGRGDGRLEQFVDEQLAFWRERVAGQLSAGRVALARNTNAEGVNEGALLHLAIQDCGIHAVSFYGARFGSMEGS